MKGIVFKHFLELVEDKFGDETVEEIIESSNLPSEGAYTGIGTYDHSEILSLVTSLSKKTKIAIPALVKVFGGYLVNVFAKGHPTFFKDKTLFEFLESVDQIIHVEVKKLYPKAELPEFSCERLDEKTLKMTYSSSRPFADLAEGLISGTIDYFGGDHRVPSTELNGPPGTHREFIIQEAA